MTRRKLFHRVIFNRAPAVRVAEYAASRCSGGPGATAIRNDLGAQKSQDLQGKNGGMNYPWEKPHTPDANLLAAEAAKRTPKRPAG